MGLEGMADGAVLSGIPRQMALKFSAYAIMVSESSKKYFDFPHFLVPVKFSYIFCWFAQSAARLVLEKGISPADVSMEIYGIKIIMI